MRVKAAWYHLVFWSISFFILFRLFTISYSNGLADVLYTFLFHLPLILLVYLNLQLAERLIKRKKYRAYMIGALSVLIISVLFHFLIFEILADLVFPGYYFISYYSIWEILQFSISYLIISLLLKLSSDWFTMKEDQLALQRENYSVKLNNLKAQLNPHFLFNSLNNIYSLAGHKDPHTRNYISKLSDALRYMIYDTDETFVPLSNEIKYIEDYIALESLRLESTEKISFSKRGESDNHFIAPLLLLPVVENAFKHCNRTDPEIKISILIQDDIFILETKNNISADSISQEGGVGLANARNRLRMLYPANSSLEIRRNPGYFHALFKLNLAPV